MKKFLFGLFLIGVSFNAYAVIIDFDEYDNTSSDVGANSVTSKGFYFETDGSISGSILHWRRDRSENADPDGVTYSHNLRGLTSTLTKVTGESFTLNSIDFGNIWNEPSSQTIRVTGYYEVGGSVFEDIVTDTLVGLETFAFKWTGLTSVTWYGGTSFGPQLDNVVLDVPIAGVPVPAAVWLIGFSLVGLSGLRCTKKNA